MSQEKKTDWKFFVILLIALALGFVVGSWPKDNHEDVFAEREQIYKEKEALLQKTIDSLTWNIQKNDSIVKNIRDSIENLKPVYIQTIEKIRELPTTEGVEYLNQKLREYETKGR